MHLFTLMSFVWNFSEGLAQQVCGYLTSLSRSYVWSALGKTEMSITALPDCLRLYFYNYWLLPKLIFVFWDVSCLEKHPKPPVPCYSLTRCYTELRNNLPWRHHWEGMTYRDHSIPVTYTCTLMGSAAISVTLWTEIPLPGVWRTLICATGSFTQLMRSVKSTRQFLKWKCWQFPLKQQAPQPRR